MKLLRYVLLFGLTGVALASENPAAVVAPPPAAAKNNLGEARTPLADPRQCHSEVKTSASGLESLRDCEGAPEIIALGGGIFRMGDQIGDGLSYERPAHSVRIHPFALGRFEVTNAEWQACVKARACTEPSVPVAPLHERYPVAGVSWTQAKSYVAWLSRRTGKPYRLASEAEWEYAARAGDSGRYPWGNLEPVSCRFANLFDASGRRQHPDWFWAENCDDHFGGAAPVGSFPANRWGFYDMLGNVWEWVDDCWHPDFEGAPSDGSSWTPPACPKHVNRGGGWGNGVRALRLSNRDGDPGDGTSDGLGFRVARSLSPSELPKGDASLPDSVPRAGETVATVQNAAAPSPPPEPSATTPRPVQSTPVVPVLTSAPAASVVSLATERDLQVHITVKGQQSWRNELQHSDGTTVQDYSMSTRLRSDGILYGDNLIDLDPVVRGENKARYYARRGLLRLKFLNGGHLPHTAEEIAALQAKLQASMPDCVRDEHCAGSEIEGLAALDALRSNSVEDLEAEMAAPATGDAARWLYFFGYPGCPVRIHVTNETHVSGERAYDRAKKRLKPWSLDRSADTEGDAEDRSLLCQRYVATVDVRSGDVFLENLYIPSAPGRTTRGLGGHAEVEDDELPVPQALLSWTTAQLRHTREASAFSAVLTERAPLDGDNTVLGNFEGLLDSTLTWSFKPVNGASLAVVPPPTITK